MALVVFLALLSAPFYVYEQRIAELWFEPLGPKRFRAHLATGALCHFDSYEILGDQWQLDAGFVKWKGVGVLLGLPSLYRLERLTGRYASVDEQNRATKLSHNLAPRVLFDVFLAVHGNRFFGALVDAEFGSSVFMDINPGQRYRVYRTEDALIARVVEPSPPPTADGPMTVIIDKACGESPGPLEWISRRVNALVTAIFY